MRSAAILSLSLALAAACGTQEGEVGEGDASAAATVVEAYVTPPPVAGGAGALYGTLRGGAEPDALVGIVGSGIGEASLHVSREGADGRRTMTPVDSLPLPAGGVLELRPGGAHGMLMGLDPERTAAGTLALELVLRSGVRLPVRARVVAPAELEGLLSPHGH